MAREFASFHRFGRKIVIVSGGCATGGDEFAEDIAYHFKCDKIIHYPQRKDIDLDLFAKNPRAALAQINYARNTLVARDSHQLIALVAKDRTGGTEDTIKKFERFHIGRRAIIL